jgi:hypothetical protein
MRGVAEYVMRGRKQALLVAVITAGIPMFFWVSAAVVGLVTLRRGLRDGLAVMLASLVPGVVVAYYGEIMPAVALLGVAPLAWLLRITGSWSASLCAAAALGLLFSAGLYTVGSAYLAGVEKLFAQVFESMTLPAAENGTAVLVPPAAADIAGMFGLILGMTLVVCLIIARWWQALLYNEGGFRREFLALRLAPTQVLGLVAVSALLLAMGPAFRLWAWVPLVPMLFSGLALAHALLAARGWGGWMGLFYAALLLLPPTKQFLVVLAAMDGWLDFRRRWLKPPGG